MMNKLLAALSISLVAMVGCTIETGTTDIAPTTLTGTVGGQSWTFAAGHTDSFLSEGEDDFFAVLYPTAFTPCGFSEPGGPHLIVSIPKQPGDYDLDLGRNMTFVDGDSRNLVTFDGRIVVDEVSAGRVVGGLTGFYDGANEVNGRFEVTVCPE